MEFAKKLQERTGKGYLSYSACKYAADGSKQQDMKLFELYMRGLLKKDSPALTFGSLYDTMLLEPDELENRFLIFNDEEILDKLSKSYKSPKSSKAYKEYVSQFEEEAEIEGKSVVSTDDVAMSGDMIARLKSSYIKTTDGKMVNIYDEFLSGGEVQGEILGWIGDIPVRGFTDFVKGDRSMIVDSKSTRSIHGFRYDVKNFCYDIQAYIYTEALGITDFYWVVQEKSKPYLCGVYKASERTIEDGKRKFWSAVENIDGWLSDPQMETESFALYGEI